MIVSILTFILNTHPQNLFCHRDFGRDEMWVPVLTLLSWSNNSILCFKNENMKKDGNMRVGRNIFKYTYVVDFLHCPPNSISLPL